MSIYFSAFKRLCLDLYFLLTNNKNYFSSKKFVAKTAEVSCKHINDIQSGENIHQNNESTETQPEDIISKIKETKLKQAERSKKKASDGRFITTFLRIIYKQSKKNIFTYS